MPRGACSRRSWRRSAARSFPALWPALRTRSPRTGSGVLAYLDPGVSGSRREEAALREVFAPVHVLGPAELLGRLGDASGYAAVVVSAHGTEPSRHGGPSEHADHRPDLGLAQGLLLESGEQLTAAQLLMCKLPDAFITPSCWSGRLAVRTAVEPLGLPTAALLAGARWVLAGTVDIGGTTTATLLSRFYRQLAAGRTPAAALQRVQVDYVKQRTLTTPGTWAGLTLIGDGFGPLPAARRESRSE